MKKYKKLIAGLILFLIVAVAFISIATVFLIPYNSKTEKIHKTLYSNDEDMDEVDICLIGGSHGLNAFNPSVMWGTEHIRAYNFCYAGETLALTKYYLEELYKKREFSLVVVDAYYAGLDDRHFGETDYCFDVASKMRLNKSKLDYVNSHVSKYIRYEYLFPIIRYHTRWGQVTSADMTRSANLADDYLLGSDYHYDKNDGFEVAFGKWSDTDASYELKDTIENDIREIIELAQSHGSQIFFADIPRVYNDSLQPAKWMPDEYAVVNRVREIAGEYDVEVMQLDAKKLKKIKFNPSTMMYNKGHMNIVGSEIYSRELASYIVKNYDVKTYEEDAIWDTYYAKYIEQKIENEEEGLLKQYGITFEDEDE